MLLMVKKDEPQLNLEKRLDIEKNTGNSSSPFIK
jgi:hypothetical protein